MLRAGGRGLHLRRGLRGAARHAARQRGRHDAVRAQPIVKLELHPRAAADAGRTSSSRPASNSPAAARAPAAAARCACWKATCPSPRRCGMRSANRRSARAGVWPAARRPAERVVVEVEQWSLPVLTDEAHVPIEPRAGRGAVIDLGTTTLVVADRRSHHRRSVARRDRAQPAGALRRRRDEPPAIRPAPAGRTGPRDPRGAGRACWASEPLREVLVAGNTAMHHLFCGLDVEPLTHAPFASPTLGGYRFADSELGWPGPAEFLPCLGGFVGSDLLCGIVATRLDEQTQPHALLRHRHQRRDRGGVGARDPVRVDGGRSGLRRRAHRRGDARGHGRDRQRCTCATAASTATSSAAARRAASAAAGWWTRRPAASNCGLIGAQRPPDRRGQALCRWPAVSH